MNRTWLTCFLRKLALARFDEATKLVIVSWEGNKLVIVFSKSAISDGVEGAPIVGDWDSNLPIESIVVVEDKIRLSSVRTKLFRWQVNEFIISLLQSERTNWFCTLYRIKKIRYTTRTDITVYSKLFIDGQWEGSVKNGDKGAIQIIRDTIRQWFLTLKARRPTKD